MRFSLSLLLISFTFVLINCDDENTPEDAGIPHTPFSVRIDLNNPTYISLNPFGGHYTLDNEGYKGILIYHNLDGGYDAFERACTYQPTNPCARIIPEKDGQLLVCGNYEGKEFKPCCASKFQWSGFPTQGPAQVGLLKYQTSRNGNFLTIYND